MQYLTASLYFFKLLISCGANSVCLLLFSIHHKYMKKKYIYIHKEKRNIQIKIDFRVLNDKVQFRAKKVLFYRLCCVLFLNLISP